MKRRETAKARADGSRLCVLWRRRTSAYSLCFSKVYMVFALACLIVALVFYIIFASVRDTAHDEHTRGHVSTPVHMSTYTHKPRWHGAQRVERFQKFTDRMIERAMS